MKVSSGPGSEELQRIYKDRFEGRTDYRIEVWKVLASFFSKWVPSQGKVLDLGAGYCEFINLIDAEVKYAMDLNPETAARANESVLVLRQDCAQPWPFPPDSLDAVFTSNFLEHLPDKQAICKTLLEAHRCLKPAGCLVAVGPNIKYVPGAYWDFFDHFVPLTELSLAEAMKNCGFTIESEIGRFLPYTMSTGRRYPSWTVKMYLACPWLWPLFGKQFLIIGRK